MSYLKGSEWRKWDLHVHTPFSCLNNQFGNNFDEYVRQLFKKAIENDIAAIGITDYFTIEGYKKLKQDYIENEEKLKELFTEDEIEKIKQILILPNIEFRINQKNKDSEFINLHLVFSNQVEISEIEAFLERLPLMSTDDVNLTRKYCSKKDLKEVGYDKALINHEKLLEKLREDFKEIDEYITVGVISGYGNIRPKYANGRGAEFAKEIDKNCHFFFGKRSNVDFFLNKTGDRKNYNLPPKAVIYSSDSHAFEEMFSKFTWIKADPTFEGLKQIIYEPEERVFIGEEPELIRRVRENKTKFIKTLRINQVEGYDENSGIWFKDIEIPFNPGLVAIIGNKGNGKSAIADILGLCGNSHQYNDFSFLNKDRFLKSGLAKNFEAELEWESGEKVKKNLSDAVDINAPERVRYLPQNYFEKLTNSLDDYEFEKTLERVVFSHIPEEQKLGKNSFEELINYKKQAVNEEIEFILREIRKLNEKIIELEKKTHPNYKKRLENKLKVKRRELEEHEKNRPNEVKNPKEDETLSDEQRKMLEELEKLNKKLEETEKLIKQKKEEIVTILKELEGLQNIKNELEYYNNLVSKYIFESGEEFEKYGLNIYDVIKLEINFELVDEKIKRKKSEIKEIEQKLEEKLKDKEDTAKKINNIKEKLSEQEKRYQQYLEELKRWEEKRNQLIGDEQTFDTIKWLEKELEFIESELNNRLEELRSKRIKKTLSIYDKKNELIAIYRSFKNAIDSEITKYKDILGDYEINIDASLKIDQRFYERFLSYINQKVKGSFYGKVEGETMLKELLDKIDVNSRDSIKKMLNEILRYLEYDQREQFKDERRYITDQINKKKLKDFYDYVFSLEYLEPSYELRLGNKSLPQLSPGEKGAMLIVFYLMLDKENIPLIIDQPEENLDNESIYRILTHFIKHTKRKRQIIMVTHNPNLAIVGDAEQIIFVNIDKKNGNKFSFEAGSIENPIINKHASDILEGTLKAFNVRRLKYFNTQMFENV